MIVAHNTGKSLWTPQTPDGAQEGLVLKPSGADCRCFVIVAIMHVTVVSLAALGYTMTPLARGQTEFPNKRDPSSPDCEVVVWRVDVKPLL